MVQDDKKLFFISQEPYIISLSLVVHKYKMISPVIFFIFSKLWFFGLLGGSKGKTDKKLSPLHLSQEPYIIWSWFMVHMCKRIVFILKGYSMQYQGEELKKWWLKKYIYARVFIEGKILSINLKGGNLHWKFVATYHNLWFVVTLFEACYSIKFFFIDFFNCRNSNFFMQSYLEYMIIFTKSKQKGS